MRNQVARKKYCSTFPDRRAIRRFFYAQPSYTPANGRKIPRMETATSTPQLISIAKASKLTPSKVTPAAVWRWARKGVKASNGERIHLEYRRVARCMYTTEEWLAAFFKAVTDADNAPSIEATQSTPRRRGPSAEVMRELEEAGI